MRFSFSPEGSAKNLVSVDHCRTLADKKGCTPGQLALADVNRDSLNQGSQAGAGQEGAHKGGNPAFHEKLDDRHASPYPGLLA
jgi:hypothetical protein